MDENQSVTAEATEPLIQRPALEEPDCPSFSATQVINPPSRQPSSLLLRLIAAGLCCMAVVYCKVKLPQQADWLRRWIIGDGSEQIQQAFSGFDDALRNGEGLYTAVSTFCETLADETV